MTLNMTVEKESRLKTDLSTGLLTIEIDTLQKEYGKNEFTKQKEPSFFVELLSVLKEPLMLILLFAGGLSALIGEFKDAIAIVMAVLVGVIIGRLTEGRAKKAAEALSSLTDDIYVNVKRNKTMQQIHKSELVMQDVVVLESGDMIPADGFIREEISLYVREDMLTGEAEPVLKQVNDSVFGGTFISSGRAIMQVSAIGDQTEMGKIAQLLTTDEQLTPLQLKLGHLGKRISTISSCVAFSLFAYMLYQTMQAEAISLNLMDAQNLTKLRNVFPELKMSFIVCVGLIVAAVPEGLPTLVNMLLAVTMNKMAKINVLIRKKEACETVGAVSVICSDKTGTLTANKMQVTQLFVDGQFIALEEIDSYPLLKLNCVVNSTAEIEFQEHGPMYIGNPTEGALLLMAAPKSYTRDRDETPVIKQLPFSSHTKQMSTVIKKSNHLISLVKGAPEVILEQCQFEMIEGRTSKLSKQRVNDLLAMMKVFQESAMRVIAFAYKDLSNTQNITATSMTSQLIFHGFVAIKDPLREGVKESIQLAKDANIETKILTGDNIHTASAIGKELGIVSNNKRIVEASYIDSLTDEQLKLEIEDIAIIARSLPTTKLRVVEALQSNGEIVAVTGDGINDAPALSKADVGIAMGIAGTEVSKSAADIILIDDSFNTIIDAIKWGRGIYNNFQRFLQFSLSVNVIAFLITILTQLLGLPLPFNTIHLLWVNLIMDGPTALALGLEPVRDTVMGRKPIKKEANIINKLMVVNIMMTSTYMIFILVLQLQTNFLGADLTRSVHQASENQTVVFCLFATFILFNAFNCREFGLASLIPNFKKNTSLIKAVILTLILQIVMTQCASEFFYTVPLSILMWIKIIVLSLSVIAVSEMIKAVLRQLNNGRKTTTRRLKSFKTY